MRFQLTFLFSLCFSFLLSAQDTIVLTSGERVEGTIIEVGRKEVLYKKSNNTSGPIYRMDIYDIGRIEYGSGAVDNFHTVRTELFSKKVNDEFPAPPGNNIISMSVFELAFQKVTVSYERILGKQRRLGLRLPLCVRLGDVGDETLNPNKVIYYTGLDLNFYPLGQSRTSFFLGPTVRAGVGRFRGNIYEDFGQQLVIRNANFLTFMFQGGFVANPIPELSLSLSLGFGTRLYLVENTFSNRNLGVFNLNFGVGYRF